MKESVSWKSIFLIAAIVYLVSPVDLASGIPVDDLVVLGTALVPFFKRTA